MDEMRKTGARELTMDEMDMVSGGAGKPLEPKKGYWIYQLEKGDTLNRVSRKFNCTVADILKWNPKITDKHKINAGDYIYIKQ